MLACQNMKERENEKKERERDVHLLNYQEFSRNDLS